MKAKHLWQDKPQNNDILRELYRMRIECFYRRLLEPFVDIPVTPQIWEKITNVIRDYLADIGYKVK